MIPKVIHYCWFGRNPLPPSAIKCINSWKKFFPDYEIKEWNEDNFDVNLIPYTQEAYAAKKYAFVSDYARFWILYHYGGLYFDTDVEVIKNMDDIVEAGPFMGFEGSVSTTSANIEAINPGLGLAATPSLELYKKMLDIYSTMNFYSSDGKMNPVSMSGITIYPPEYFDPWDDVLGKLNKTPNTRSIHWYSKTWLPYEPFITKWSKRLVRRIFGKNSLAWLKRLLRK